LREAKCCRRKPYNWELKWKCEKIERACYISMNMHLVENKFQRNIKKEIKGIFEITILKRVTIVEFYLDFIPTILSFLLFMFKIREYIGRFKSLKG